MYGLEGWKGYFPNQFICLLGVSFVVVADTYCWNSWSPICWLRTVLYILELKIYCMFFFFMPFNDTAESKIQNLYTNISAKLKTYSKILQHVK